jgi:large subunit ribosomal protein L19
MDLIKAIDAEQLRTDVAEFNIGDTIKVHYKIVEGQTERVQVYEGVCIAMSNGGISKTFTVRKMSYGVGVERIFPFSSPRIHMVEVVKRGKVRRAKLFYIRDRIGKKAKIAEKLVKKENKVKEPQA